MPFRGVVLVYLVALRLAHNHFDRADSAASMHAPEFVVALDARGINQVREFLGLPDESGVFDRHGNLSGRRQNRQCAARNHALVSGGSAKAMSERVVVGPYAMEILGISNEAGVGDNGGLII